MLTRKVERKLKLILIQSQGSLLRNQHVSQIDTLGHRGYTLTVVTSTHTDKKRKGSIKRVVHLSNPPWHYYRTGSAYLLTEGKMGPTINEIYTPHRACQKVNHQLFNSQSELSEAISRAGNASGFDTRVLPCILLAGVLQENTCEMRW
jgi:hypothetical protein